MLEEMLEAMLEVGTSGGDGDAILGLEAIGPGWMAFERRLLDAVAQMEDAFVDSVDEWVDGFLVGDPMAEEA